jgi:hypothetical protein
VEWKGLIPVIIFSLEDTDIGGVNRRGKEGVMKKRWDIALLTILIVAVLVTQ